MSEQDILGKLERKKLWKNKYPLSYCNLCNTWVISCEVCNNSSCNGSGCTECIEDFKKFCDITKHRVTSYLNKKERNTFRKIEHLHKMIPECLSVGFTEINWKWLHEQGKLCLMDYYLFPKELKDFKQEAIKNIGSKELAEQLEKEYS